MNNTSTIRAIQIQATGFTEQRIAAGGEGVRESMGCRVFDVISLEHGIDLWVDDEGLLQAEPVLNLPATILAHVLGVRTAIFGTAIALSVDLSTGESKGLTDRQVHRIHEVLRHPDRDTLTAVAATLSVLIPSR